MQPVQKKHGHGPYGSSKLLTKILNNKLLARTLEDPGYNFFLTYGIIISMSWYVIFGIIVGLLLLFPAGRKVLVVALGLIYIPLQHLFMWLQKVNLSLKDRDPFLYYISCVFIYPLYAIIIPISKLYEVMSEKFH